MYNLQETSIEWALLHVTNFYDSDFYPRLFEFEAIKANWPNIKSHLLALDLDKYAPQNPVISLALKPNENFRVVHQLDPIDSLIYSAILYENATNIENFRLPKGRKMACSYRIKTDTTGSYFEREVTGYVEFISQAESLADDFDGGYVLICDIADFYNQIYLHRVNNVLSESGSKSSKVIEEFLSGLNTNISRGIPVGPAPSILVAELIMADIDKKILSYTNFFTRYVDDIYIFFEIEEDAVIILHELTKYLYSTHRLVFSSEKTRILSVEKFKQFYLKEEERLEKQAILEQLKDAGAGPYKTVDEVSEIEELDPPDRFKVRSKVYLKLFSKSLELDQLDLSLTRHILRQAGKYKVRNIIPLVFKNFTKLLPAIREIVIYFEKVLNERTVEKYQKEFRRLLEHPYIDLLFINIWIFTLFQNEWFNIIELDIDYSKIRRIRERALIAKREKNTTWIKDIKDGVDTLGPWDKRAVYFSSAIMSKDEAIHWLGLELSKGDLLNKAVCSLAILNQKMGK